MKTSITSQALIIALIKHTPQPWTRAIAMHLALARLYDAERGYASCTEEQLATELKITIRTLRNLKAQVLDSGLWTSQRGNRVGPSTYTPSKRLVALVRRDAR